MRDLWKDLRGRAVWWAVTILVIPAVLSCDGAPPAESRGVTLGGNTKPAEEGQDLTDCEGAPAPAPTALVATTPRKVRLYIDGSGSMKGFAGQGDRFAAVLGGLRPMLLDLKVLESQVSWVGSHLEAQEHHGGFDRYDLRDYYFRSETNLAEALEAAKLGVEDSLVLVLTDGVMSLSRDTGAPGKLPDCERGSDVHCLTYKLDQLSQSGGGFWILGLRSPFRGSLYSELLKPGGANLGEVDLPDRPFYLWVIASHPPTARALIQKLLARIDAKTDGQAVFALEIAPGHLPWMMPRPEVPPSSDNRLFPQSARNGAVLGRYSPTTGGEAGTQVVANSNLGGTAFGVQLPLASTELTARPDGVAPFWEYRLSYCLRWDVKPAKALVRVRALEEGEQLHLALFTPTFQRLAGKRVTVVRRLIRESLATEALRDLNAWSTADDRTPAQGSRTLHLEEFLDALRTRLTLEEAYEQPLLTLKFE